MDMCMLDNSGQILSKTPKNETSEQSDGKEYAFFVSYSSKDSELIQPIVEQLENEPYQLKCCLDHREFLPGRSNIQNIEWGLTSCKAVALFLTPNFIESNYCKHELDLALTLAMEKKGKLVPVLLKPCKLPATLGRLQYLEESDPIVIAKKLACWLETDFNGGLPLDGRLAGSGKVTGCEGKLYWTNIGDGYKDLSVDNNENKITFNTLGITVSDDLKIQLHRIAIIAGRFPSLSNNMWTLACSIFLAVAAIGVQIGFLPVLMFDKYRQNFPTDEETILLITLPMAAFVVVLLIVITMFHRKEKTKKEALATTNLTTYKYKAVFYFDFDLFVKGINGVMIVKCDFDECKAYLKQGYTEDEHFEAWWDQLIMSSAGRRYFKGLTSKCLPKTCDPRHLVVNSAVCFCQWYEEIEDAIRHKTDATAVDIEEESTGVVSSASDDEQASLLQHEHPV